VRSRQMAAVGEPVLAVKERDAVFLLEERRQQQ
jgi:hypothetical protein